MKWWCLSLLFVSSMAAAQTCPEGQVVNEDTRGRCCWPGQAWSNARNACVGTPQCPVGWIVEPASCRLASQAPPSPAPAPAAAPPTVHQVPADAPLPPPAPMPGSTGLTASEDRILKHMQLTNELAELQRDLEQQKWISSFIVAGAVGAGLWGVGYVLFTIFNAVFPPNVAGYAAGWTLFGCGLGGSITFVVMAIVGTVQLIKWILIKQRIQKKTEELREYDEKNGLQNLPPPAPSSWLRGPEAGLVVLRF